MVMFLGPDGKVWDVASPQIDGAPFGVPNDW
jgi:hypothetical protein